MRKLFLLMALAAVACGACATETKTIEIKTVDASGSDGK